MTKNAGFTARLCVGSVDGPNSAIWRVWTNSAKSDVYVGVREVAAQFKVSLHGTGVCNAGLTTPFAEKEAAAVARLGGSRHQSMWTRKTHVGSQIVTPFQVSIPASELTRWRTVPVKNEGITWLAAPAPTNSVVVSCVFSGQSIHTDDWPGRTNGTHLAGTTVLPNGEKFWLLWQDCPTTAEERAIIAEGAALRQKPGMVHFSGAHENVPGPRNLLFKDFPDDRLLVVIDARAP